MAERHRIAFRWQRRPPGRVTARLRAVAAAALAAVDAEAGELGVLVCDDEGMRALNRRFRDKDAPTDVLSFPSGERWPDGDTYLGDIAISLDTARRQADAAGITVEEELELLLLHGVLHVCGWDHERDDGEMEALEMRLRKELTG